jgi:hypothetical protein
VKEVIRDETARGTTGVARHKAGSCPVTEARAVDVCKEKKEQSSMLGSRG